MQLASRKREERRDEGKGKKVRKEGKKESGKVTLKKGKEGRFKNRKIKIRHQGLKKKGKNELGKEGRKK